MSCVQTYKFYSLHLVGNYFFKFEFGAKFEFINYFSNNQKKKLKNKNPHFCQQIEIVFLFFINHLKSNTPFYIKKNNILIYFTNLPFSIFHFPKNEKTFKSCHFQPSKNDIYTIFAFLYFFFISTLFSLKSYIISPAIPCYLISIFNPKQNKKKTHPRENLNFVAFKTVSIGLISNQMQILPHFSKQLCVNRIMLAR